MAEQDEHRNTTANDLRDQEQGASAIDRQYDERFSPGGRSGTDSDETRRDLGDQEDGAARSQANNDTDGSSRSGKSGGSRSGSRSSTSESTAAAGGADSINFTGGGENETTTGGGKAGIFGRLKGSGKRAASFAKKHKKKLLLAGGAGAGLVPIAAVFIFLLAALGLPNFAQDMAAWQFAKVTRNYARTSNTVMDQMESVAASNDTAYERMRARYQNLRSNTWGKLDNLRPNKIIQNLNNNNELQYIYKPRSGIAGKVGLQKLTAINIAGQQVDVPESSFTGRYLHPIQSLQNNSSFLNALDEAIEANNPKIPVFVRSAVVKKITQELGVHWTGIVAAKAYKGKTPDQARVQLQQDTYKEVHQTGGATGAVSDEVKKAANEVEEETTECLDDAKCAATTVDDPVPQKVVNTLESTFESSNLQKVVGAANPIYAVAVPICMIYDGSKLSAPSINATSTQQMRSASFLLSSADQQERGDDPSTPSDHQYTNEIGGAFNDKLNGNDDMNQSNVLRRAAGKPVDTRQDYAAQATPLGSFKDTSIFDVIFSGAPAISNVFDSFASGSCPALTNVWVGLGLGAINIGVAVAGIFTGGASTTAQVAAEEATQQAALTGVRLLAQRFAEKFTTKAGLQLLGKGAWQTGKSVGKEVALTEAATYLAKMIVLSRAGSASNGVPSGALFRDNADQGTNLLGNVMNKQGFYGRPLTSQETKVSISEDRNTVAGINASRSTFDRYLALSNADSLASRVGMELRGDLNHGMFASLLNNVSHVFNPSSVFSHMFGGLGPKAAFAADDSDPLTYGDVQWDWPPVEQSLIKGDLSYGMLENSKILEDSGKMDEIESKYGPCYSSMDGDLLEKKDINRTENGDTLADDSLCSPKSLGCHMDNGKCVAKNRCTSENAEGACTTSEYDYQDLIFRWRLYHSLDNASDNLTAVQDATASAGSSS